MKVFTGRWGWSETSVLRSPLLATYTDHHLSTRESFQLNAGTQPHFQHPHQAFRCLQYQTVSVISWIEAQYEGCQGTEAIFLTTVEFWSQLLSYVLFRIAVSQERRRQGKSMDVWGWSETVYRKAPFQHTTQGRQTSHWPELFPGKLNVITVCSQVIWSTWLCNVPSLRFYCPLSVWATPQGLPLSPSSPSLLLPPLKHLTLFVPSPRFYCCFLAEVLLCP